MSRIINGDKNMDEIIDLDVLRERNRAYVDSYCSRYNLRLLEVRETFENNRYEPMYFFDDNLGGYTLEGIIGSLM
jgi:hypothetical protein